MRSVWKYKLSLEISTNAISMPKEAKILSFDKQVDALFIWVEVETENPEEIRFLYIIGTGHRIPGVAKYIATCQDPPFIWHLYEAAL